MRRILELIWSQCVCACIYLPHYPDAKSAMHTGELPNWQFHYYVPYAPAMHPFPQPSAVIGLKMGSMVYIKGHSCHVFVHIEEKCAKKMDL